MSTLQLIERATISLSRKEREQLRLFLMEFEEQHPASPSPQQNMHEADLRDLHPELLPMIGSIPSDAELDLDDIHAYRLLKHA